MSKRSPPANPYRPSRPTRSVASKNPWYSDETFYLDDDSYDDKPTAATSNTSSVITIVNFPVICCSLFPKWRRRWTKGGKNGPCGEWLPHSIYLSDYARKGTPCLAALSVWGWGMYKSPFFRKKMGRETIFFWGCVARGRTSHKKKALYNSGGKIHFTFFRQIPLSLYSVTPSKGPLKRCRVNI